MQLADDHHDHDDETAVEKLDKELFSSLNSLSRDVLSDRTLSFIPEFINNSF